jgi:hypothetical protein
VTTQLQLIIIIIIIIIIIMIIIIHTHTTYAPISNLEGMTYFYEILLGTYGIWAAPVTCFLISCKWK